MSAWFLLFLFVAGIALVLRLAARPRDDLRHIPPARVSGMLWRRSAPWK